MIDVGLGQREGLLLQFDSPGTYRVMQYLVPDHFDVYNKTSVPTAFIQVDEACGAKVEPVNISSFKFTPGMNTSGDIKDSELDGNPNLVKFGLGFDNTKAPFVQFESNHASFHVGEIKHTMNASYASEWNLTSALGFDPFHIQ
jgi:hypothetical protein